MIAVQLNDVIQITSYLNLKNPKTTSDGYLEQSVKEIVLDYVGVTLIPKPDILSSQTIKSLCSGASLSIRDFVRFGI